MVTIVRVARALLILALAFVAISFVIGIGTSSTGLLEKAVLLALIGGCVYAAAKVTTFGERMVHRLER
jgi:membrane associated rhomboid family serine protease